MEVGDQIEAGPSATGIGIAGPTSTLLRFLGCTLYSDYHAMLDACKGRADLCVIPTGIAWHERMACAGIDNLIVDAFDRELLLGECGVEWARPGAPMDVRGYARFEGPCA